MNARPLTLRDVRRMLSAGWTFDEFDAAWLVRLGPVVAWDERGFGTFRGGRKVLHQVEVAPWVADAVTHYIDTTASWAIDRLISLHGADTLCGRKAAKPEARPKDTDEVAEQSDDPSDGQKHGGDGASGEVTDGQPTGGQNPNTAEEMAEPSATPGQGGAQPQDSTDTETANGGSGHGSETTSQDGAPDASESSSGDAAEGQPSTGATRDVSPTPGQAQDKGEQPHNESAGLAETDDLGRDAPGVAGVSTTDDAGATPAKESRDLDPSAADSADDEATTSVGTPRSSRRSKAQHGGVFAEIGRGTRRHPVDPKDVAEIRRHLRRLLDRIEVEPGGDPSPRISGKRLAREVVARRVSLSRSRREEVKPAVRLILCDVSGSCSAVCRETVAAAQALVADQDARCVVVLHSNGYPAAWIGDVGDMPDVRDAGDWRGTDEVRAWWDRLVAGRTVSGVVWLGDSDGLWVLEHIAAAAPVVWLDSHCSRSGLHSAPRKAVEQLNFRPIAWWWGVNNARSTAIALRSTR